MPESVKAELEEAWIFVEDNEVYLSLKYKNAKMEDGRIVRVWYPKIRLPISTNALPEVKERSGNYRGKSHGDPEKRIWMSCKSHKERGRFR